MNYRMKCISTALLLAIFSLTLAACGRDADKDKSTPALEKQDVSSAKPTQATKRPPSPPRPPAEILPVNGKILEILDTGSFLYLSMDWNGKKIWATVPGVVLKVGEVISLEHATMIKRFYSKTLNRTFEEIVFAAGVTGKSPRPRGAHNSNLNDPRNRRSGQLMGGMPPTAVPPAPVPARPAAKPAAKANP